MKASVVIAAVSGQQAREVCVASVRRAATAEDLELIVLAGSPPDYSRLWARGLEQASGERVAVLGDRYEAGAAWIDALLAGERFDVMAGPVGPGARLGYWGWCVYLTEYAHVAPPVATQPARAAKQIPSGNVVYNRQILRSYPRSPAVTDLRFHALLLAAQARIEIRPELTVQFATPPDVREYLRERFAYSRAIGAEGGARKAVVALSLPVLVPLRAAAAVFQRSRYRFRFLTCAPVLVLLGFVQAAGEFLGAVAGQWGRT